MRTATLAALALMVACGDHECDTDVDPDTADVDTEEVDTDIDTAAPCAEVPEPLLWMPMELSAADATGNETVDERNTPFFIPGLSGESMLFGSDRWLRVEDPAFFLGDGSRSFEAWVNMPATFQTLLSYDECAGACASESWSFLTVTVDQSGLLRGGVRAQGTTTATSVQGVTPVSDNVWHHVAFVVDHDDLAIRLFVDGELDASTPIANLADVSPLGESNDGDVDSIDFGRNRYAPVGGLSQEAFYLGLMDEVALYDVALSDDDVEALFEAGRAGRCE